MGQWVVYRVAEGALLKAPLPSAPEAGQGWRGIGLRRPRTLEQLDDLVEETAAKVEAAAAFSVHEDFAYVVAAASGRPTVRLVFGSGAAEPSPAAEEAAARRGPASAKQQAAALAAWSAHAPHEVRAKDVAALLKEAIAPEKAAEALALLLGLSLPAEAVPNPLDLQSVARKHLDEASQEGPKRRKGGFWRAR